MRLAIVLAVLGSTTALAGVTVVYDRVDRTGKPSTMTLKLEGDKLRSDTPAMRVTRMLWDGSKKVAVMVRDGDKVYSRLDEPQAKAFKERMAAAREKSSASLASSRAGLEAQMAKMPPAQRAQMEQMLKSMPQPGEPPKYEPPKFTATGKKQKVGEWSCEVHEAPRDNGKLEVCVIPWDKAPLKKDDLAPLVSMSEFFVEMMGGLGGMQGDDAFTRELHRYPGYPVQSAFVDAGGQRSTFTTKSVTRGTVPASEFAPPDGYTEQPMPGFGAPPGKAP